MARRTWRCGRFISREASPLSVILGSDAVIKGRAIYKNRQAEMSAVDRLDARPSGDVEPISITSAPPPIMTAEVAIANARHHAQRALAMNTAGADDTPATIYALKAQQALGGRFRSSDTAQPRKPASL